MALAQVGSGIKQKLAGILQKKNIAKNEALSKCLLEFDVEKFPYDRNSLLNESGGNFQKLALEIGSGWGEFTLEMAQKNPDTLIIALEKKRKRVYRSSRLQVRQQLPNIRWLVINLHWFFSEVFAENTFDSVVINFPDPWPKIRHQKHRFISADFINQLALITRKNATLEFASDYFEYVKEALQLLQAHDHWSNIHGDGIVLSQIAGRPQSFFELEKRQQGENCYFVQFRNEKELMRH